jgi:hypothetical protein
MDAAESVVNCAPTAASLYMEIMAENRSVVYEEATVLMIKANDRRHQPPRVG